MSALAGTVTGTVRDSATNTTISGVTVKVHQQSGKTATTNSSGVYSITNVTAGTVTLNASKTAYVTLTTGNVTVPTSGSVTANISLTKAATIIGTVVNISGGAAVSGATVTVTGTTNSATTTSSGAFTLYQAAGTYTLTITKTGWVTATTASFVAVSGQTNDLKALQLTQNGTLSGTVVNALGGAAVSSATVTVTGTSTSTTTNTSGAFTLSVAPGAVTLTITKTSWLSKTTGSYTVTSGQTTATGAITFSQAAITGTVANAAGGTAISGATVTVTGTSNSTTTDASGGFTLSQSPGTCTLTVSKAGFTTFTTASLTVTGGQTTNAGTISLSAGASVTGTVKEQGTNALISGATVTLNGTPSNTTTTNASGVFTLGNVPLGSQRLDVSKTGYTSQTTAAFNVVAGTNTVPDIQLVKAVGTITGTITDAQAAGAGLSGATVKVNGSSPLISTTTAADGTYTLSGVPAGTVTINASATGYVAQNSGNLTVTTGANTNAGSLSLTRTTVTVSGTVRDAVSNALLQGAVITVQEQAGPSATSNASGAYSLSGVYWGSVHLIASLTGYANQTVAVTLTAGTNATQNFLMGSNLGTIAGTVTDATTGFGLLASVALADNPGQWVSSDIYGAYTLTSVSAGSHQLVVNSDRYDTLTSTSLSVSGGTTTTANLPLNPTPSSISGTVRSPENALNPIAGATVIAVRSGQSTTTDASGNFQLTGLAPGVEYLVVRVAGYRPQATGEILLAASVVTNYDPWMYASQAGDPPVTVHGTVKDATGAPIAGVSVGPVGLNPILTAADGTYSVPAPMGSYVIAASKVGFRALYTPVQSLSGPAVPWQIQEDFVLPAAAATGTVTLLTFDPVAKVPASGDLWLFGASSLYRIYVPASGTRNITMPAGQVFGWFEPKTLPSGGSLTLAFNGVGSAIPTSPHWILAGTVFRQIMGTPIAGATVTLANPAAAFTTSVTTDINGRWSFASGPVGTYEVTVSAAGLITSPTWTPTVADDNGYQQGDFALHAASDDGSLSIDTPLEGATLTTGLTSLTCTATLPRPGDYVTNAQVSLSSGSLTSATPTYSIDGRNFQVGVVTALQNGPLTVTVEAWTHYGALITATRNVTVQLPIVPTSVTLNPTSVAGGVGANGTVTLSQQAPTGGALVSLTSNNPAATVPASVTVQAGFTSADFPITTGSVPSPTSATISATYNGSTQSAVLAITTSTTGTITGTVTDATTGFGLLASVALADNPGQWVASDIYGAYTLTNVPVGSHQLVVNSDRYDTLTSAALSVSGGTTTTANLPLNPTPSSISGTIRSPENGLSPIAGATVIAVRSGQTTTSDASGAFQLTGLAPGVEYLVVRAAGYRPQATGEILLAASVVTNYDPWMYSSQAGDPPVTIHGTVKDATGAPIAGVSIGPVGLTPVLTATDGTYVMTAPMGTYVITTSKSGYRTLYTPVQSFTGDFLAPWQIQHDVDLPAATATGTVALATFDPVAKVPAGGDLWLFGSSSLYRIYVPDSGTRNITMPAGQVFGWFEPKTLPSGGSLALAFNGVSTPVPTAPHWALGGTVFHQIMGTPIAGATVTLTNAAASFTSTVTTDGNGRWGFTSGPVGTYAITMSAPGLLPSETWTPTVADDNGYQQWDLSMRAASDDGSISIDSPLEGATLTTGLTSVTCTATLPRPGDYILSAQVVLSTGTLTSATPVYDIDGRHFRLDVITSLLNGPLTLTVRAWTHYGALITATRNVTAQLPVVPVSLTLDPTSVPEGGTSTGSVTVSTAPASDTAIALASSNPAASVPASVTVLAGQTQAAFSVTTTLPSPAVDTNVTISATAAGVTTTATLTVTIPPGSIFGRTISTHGVLGGVTATITGTSNSTTTDVNGLFSLSVPPGTYSVTFSKTGFVTSTTPSLTVAPGQGVDAGETTLFQLGTLSGTVVNAAGGSPIQGATVTVTGTATSTTTDAAGAFSFSIVEGNYSLTVSKASFAPVTTGTLTVIGGQTTTSGPIQLTQGGTLAGTVVNATGGAPVSGVNVAVTGTSNQATTDASGAFSIGVAPGAYTLTLTKIGWVSQTTASFTVTGGNTTNTGPLQLNQLGTITGTVVNASGGAAIPAATVTLTGTSTSTTTDAAGNFALQATPGTATLTVTKTGFTPTTTGSLTVTSGQTTNAGTIQLAQGGTLRGTLVSSIGGSPIAGVFVLVIGTSTYTTTDPGGAFSLTLAPGSYRLSLSVAAFDPLNTSAFTVTAGQTTDTGAIALVPQARITGTVVDSSTSATLSGVYVTVTGTGNTVLTNAAGEFNVLQTAGTWTLTLQKYQYATLQSPPVTASAGQTVSVGTIQMTPGGTLTGTIVDDVSGNPLYGATVSVSGSTLTATTNSLGVFNLSLAAGSYTISVTLSTYVQYTSASAFTVVQGSQTNAGTIRLVKAGVIQGTVHDLYATWPPVPGVTVTVTGTSTSTTTASDGSFTLRPPPGTYTLTFTKTGWLSQTSSPLTIADGQTITLTVTLYQAALTGRVTDGAGNPMQGAGISYAGDLMVRQVTDASGNFTMYLDAGTFSFMATKDCFGEKVIGPLVIVPGQVTDAGTFVLSPGGVLHGTAGNGANSMILSGVTVTVNGTNVTAQSSGSGFMLFPDVGSVTLTLSMAGFQTLTAGPFTVTACQMTEVGTLTLYPLVPLPGTVVSSQGGGPITGVTVVVEGTTTTATTDAQGSFSLTLGQGNYILRFTKAGFATLRRAITISLGQTALGTYTLDPGSGTVLFGIQNLAEDTTWDVAGSPWVIVGSLTVAASTTLRIDPGVTVRFGQVLSSYLQVRGRLLAVGTSASPIVFTSYAGTPQPGDWAGIDLRGSPQSQLAFATVSYGRGVNAVTPASFDHVTFANNRGSGLSLSASAPASTVVASGFTGNTSGLIFNSGAAPPPRQDARLNYWDSATGPSEGGPGSGQSVTANVDFEPWLTAPSSFPQYLVSASLTNRAFNPAISLLPTVTITTAMTGTWKVTILDANGATVRLLTGSGATGSITWDGKNDAGAAQPGGSYRYLVEATATSGEIASPATGGLVLDPTLQFTINGLTLSNAFISPNGDGVQDTTTVTGTISLGTPTWTVNVKTASGAVVRTASGSGLNVSFTWDGKDTSGTVQPDGVYTIEVTATLGSTTATSSASVTVDATLPAVTIASPTTGQTISNFLVPGSSTDVAVSGSLADTNLVNWTLDYGSGSAPTVWTTIQSGTTGVTNAVLGTWATGSVANGPYTLRLQAWDKAGNRGIVSLPITVGHHTVTQDVVQFDISQGAHVTLTSAIPSTATQTLVIRSPSWLTDHYVTGPIVRTLVNGSRSAGTYSDTWDGTDDAGNRLKDGTFFWTSSITDGTHTYTIDKTLLVGTGFIKDPLYRRVQPHYDFFANKPVRSDFNFPVPGGVVFSFTTYWFGFLGCDPPWFCWSTDDLTEAGPHSFEWSGIDNTGATRLDMVQITAVSRQDTVPQNTIIVFGGKPTVANVSATPPVFSPASGGSQTIQFILSSYQNQPLSVTVTLMNQESQSILKSFALSGQAPGLVTLNWDGRADNGMLVSPGTYILTVTATDAVGNKNAVWNRGQILTTITY